MIKIINHCWIEPEEFGEVPYPLKEIQDYFSPNIRISNELYRRGYKLPKSLQFIKDLYDNLEEEGLEKTDCDISIMYEEIDDFEIRQTYIHFVFSSFSISCIQEDNSDNYYWRLRIEENEGPFAIAEDFKIPGYAEAIDLPYVYDFENSCLIVISDHVREWHKAVSLF